MEETPDSVSTNELRACFNELKKHSLSYKLGQVNQTSGDDTRNPLRKQFSLIMEKIDEILEKQTKDSEDYVKTICMKSSIIYEKAKIFLSENQLLSSKELLEQALELIKDYSENTKVAFLYMRIVNHLTYVLSRIGELKSAKDLLIKAIEDNKKCNPEVFSTDDLFLNNQKDAKLSRTKLNRLTLNNMQMLAWIYAKLGDTERNLEIQHDILQKQFDLAEGDVLKWAESCFRLASMFVGNCDWENARYHLAAAETVLNPLEASLIPNPELFAVQADLARSWIHYGLQLFDYSRKNMFNATVESDEELPTGKDLAQDKVNQKACLTFERLQVDIPTIPAQPIKSLQEARLFFSTLHKWVKRGRLFYTLRDYPLQYVNLCLDLSELYRFLAFYEEDIEGQYNVQKKRYDALESLCGILKEVRPNCYVAVTIELTKEIIEVQMELMNLNLKKLYVPSEVVRTDINEDILRRQIKAFSAINTKLENVTSTLDVNSPSHVVENKPTVEESKPENSETTNE